MGIYFPWMGYAWMRVCVCVRGAPKDHSSLNKALAVFNFQRCQPDLRNAGSWYISRARGPYCEASYTDMKYTAGAREFRAFVQVYRWKVAKATADSLIIFMNNGLTCCARWQRQAGAQKHAERYAHTHAVAVGHPFTWILYSFSGVCVTFTVSLPRVHMGSSSCVLWFIVVHMQCEGASANGA